MFNISKHFLAVSTAYGVPTYHELDYGDEVLNAHEVSQLALKVQKYPPLPAGNSYFHHSTPKPAPIVHPVPHHHSTPAPIVHPVPHHHSTPAPPPPVTPIPHLAPHHPPAVIHHDDPLPLNLDDNYLDYGDPVDYKVGFTLSKLQYQLHSISV